jgi:hypothetical protein
MEKLMVWNSVSWGDQNLEAQMLEHVCINIVAMTVGAIDVASTDVRLLMTTVGTRILIY